SAVEAPTRSTAGPAATTCSGRTDPTHCTAEAAPTDWRRGRRGSRETLPGPTTCCSATEAATASTVTARAVPTPSTAAPALTGCSTVTWTGTPRPIVSWAAPGSTR